MSFSYFCVRILGSVLAIFSLDFWNQNFFRSQADFEMIISGIDVGLGINVCLGDELKEIYEHLFFFPTMSGINCL